MRGIVSHRRVACHLLCHVRLYSLAVIYSAGYAAVVDVFEAVAEPTRRSVLDLLARRERSAGELVAAFPALTQPAVSRHLRILRESRLVDVRAEGTRRMYSLRPDALAELDRWLDTYRRFWSGRLDDLEARLDSKMDRKEAP
jgi:DNA-binding transcriptional ArsR family regulator